MTADDNDATPRTLQHRSLVDLAVDEVQRLILSGVYLPGDPLREQHLTDKLGMSRASLREALRVLQQRGILEQIPRRGVRVVDLSDKDVDEIYTLRDSLDRFAVSLAFPNPDPAGLALMRDAMDDMRQAADVGDHARIVLSNRSFHVALIGLSGHNRLRLTYESLMDQMQLWMSANLRRETSTSGDYIGGVRRHERLMASVEGGEPLEVLAALAAHGGRDFLGERGQDGPSDVVDQVAAQLLARTGASRTTVRWCDAGKEPRVIAESRLPGVASLAGVTDVPIRSAATYTTLERERRLLVQDDCRTGEPAPPTFLVEQFRVYAQMLAPVIVGGRIVAIISVHQQDRTRTWSDAEIAALTHAREALEAHFERTSAR